MITLKKIVLTSMVTTALIGTTYASAQVNSDTQGSTPQLSKKAMRAQDHKLEKAIRRTLTHTKHLQSSDIRVLVKGGIVTLDGTVPRDDQIQVAVDTTSTVPGVGTVKNNLVVREEGQ